MTPVDFTKVRANLAGRPLVGFEGNAEWAVSKSGMAKCGLKPGQPDIAKANGSKRGIKISESKRGIKAPA